MLRCLFRVICAYLLLYAPAMATDSPRWTMRVDLGGTEVEGMPLAWTKQHIFLLARDGRLWDFAPSKTRNYQKSSSYFSSYSAAEMRAALQRELGRRLEITGTGHYLVAHPPGKSGHWASRFEDLYRSCTDYFRLRDLKVHEPDFPLVAIVWPVREDFLRYAQLEGTPMRGDILGYYSPTTNRVTLYDLAAGSTANQMWRQNDATIIHEATHQMAFNTGVHNRFSSTPTWLAEGLGTLFEAPGVWDWRNYTQPADRINRGRLVQFRHWLESGRTTGAFVGLLGSDRLFQGNPAAAYSESWAWAFFLTETYPQKFSQYVQRTASRPNFQDYPMAQRISDFTTVFGDDLRMLEAHFLRFIAALK